MLVTPSHPIWVSRYSELSFIPSTENKIDPLIFRANPPILAGEQYTVRAYIYNPTVAQLQDAGGIYPAWVLDHYLQLPNDLSPQIRELALQITADAVTPYEKAAAITDYLRAAITYLVKVDFPPEGIDPLVWFLFDYRAGFCNYYASAEVILLRSVDIPARLAVGFAEGEYEPPDKFTIRERDAHAWPEVYFPGIGWVEFEPTSGQPPLIRLPGNSTTTGQPFSDTQGITENGNPNQPPIPVEGTRAGFGSGVQADSLRRLTLFFVLLVVVSVGLMAAYVTGLLDKIFWRTRQLAHIPLPIRLINSFTKFAIPPPDWLRSWAYFTGLKPIERTFSVVFQSLRRLGVKTSPAQTPAEAVDALSERLPEVAEDAHSLLREYQHALFSRKHNNLIIARRAAELIRRQTLRTVFHKRVTEFLAVFLGKFPFKSK